MSKKWLYRLLVIDVLLILAHIFWGEQVYVLHLDYERTIPAYYSGLKLVLISGLALTVFYLLERKREKIMWLLISLFFVGLAFDEISELHENLGEFFLGIANNFSIFEQSSFMWLIFLSPAILVVLFLLSYLVRSLHGHQAFPYVLIGLISFCLVLVLEFIGGMIIKSCPSWYAATIIAEEMMEKIGATFFLFGFLQVFKKYFHQKYQKRIN